MTTLTLVRNATLLLEFDGGSCVLVDPMLNPRGAVGAVEDTAPVIANPLVELLQGPEHWARAADVVLVTHLHNDHFDDAARRFVPAATPLFCQPDDEPRMRADGFERVMPVEQDSVLLPGVRATRVPARHTLGAAQQAALGPGSGYVLHGAFPTTYVAGDCVWSPELVETLDRFAPEVIVLNGGAARFLSGPPISMTCEDVIRTARHAPEAQVIVVHLEALSHCPMTRMS